MRPSWGPMRSEADGGACVGDGRNEEGNAEDMQGPGPDTVDEHREQSMGLEAGDGAVDAGIAAIKPTIIQAVTIRI